MAGQGRQTRGSDGKSASAFRTISEVAGLLDVPQHVLRFWESKFSQIRPMKRGGGRRYYRPEDVELLRAIRALLYDDGYTIKGVQKLLREGAIKPGRGESGRPQRAPAKAAASTNGEDELQMPSGPQRELRGLLKELEELKRRVDDVLK